MRALGDLLAAAHPQVTPDDDDLLDRPIFRCFIHVPYRTETKTGSGVPPGGDAVLEAVRVSNRFASGVSLNGSHTAVLREVKHLAMAIAPGESVNEPGSLEPPGVVSDWPKFRDQK
jgi:hypothetical protein